MKSHINAYVRVIRVRVIRVLRIRVRVIRVSVTGSIGSEPKQQRSHHWT